MGLKVGEHAIVASAFLGLPSLVSYLGEGFFLGLRDMCVL